jgi:hypothetical protein
MEEVIEILRLVDPECDAKLPRIHLVFGNYKGPLDIRYGEKVVFVGDCVQWEGQLGGQVVKIENLYKDRSTLDPHHAKHKDVYARMLRMAKKLREAKESPYVRLEGCPVSIGELILLLAELGGVKNPYFDRRQAVGFNLSYLAWRSATLMKRFRGQRYQVSGATRRGDAQPLLAPDGAAEE